MKRLFIEYILFCSMMLGQNAWGSASGEPNLTVTEPNMIEFLMSKPDPNTDPAFEAQSIPGTLAMNWLFQGKKPPQPLVGQQDITIRTGVYPWPYIGYHQDEFFDWPWFYHPWYRYSYWGYYPYDYWRYYSCDRWRAHHWYGPDWHNYDWWYNDAFTYPLNYVDVKMKLNQDTSLHFGAYFFGDPVFWP